MDTSALYKEEVTNLIKGNIRNKLIIQERVIFYESELAKIKKKKKGELTEDDQHKLELLPANITSSKEQIADIDIHIDNFSSLIKEFTEGSTVEK